MKKNIIADRNFFLKIKYSTIFILCLYLLVVPFYSKACTTTAEVSQEIKNIIFKQLFTDGISLNLYCNSEKFCKQETLYLIKSIWEDFKDKSLIQISGNWEENPHTFNTSCKYTLDVGFSLREKILDNNSDLVIKNIMTIGVNYNNNKISLDMPIWNYINSYQCLNKYKNKWDICSFSLYAHEQFRRFTLLSRIGNYPDYGFKVADLSNDVHKQKDFFKYYRNNHANRQLVFLKDPP